VKTQAIRTLYPQLTPEERVHLVLAATARGDTVEVARLDWNCPQAKIEEYRDLLDRIGHVELVLLSQWLDVSHRVLQARLAVTLMPSVVSLDEVRLRDAPPADKKKLKLAVRERRALLVGAEAKCKQWSAEWKAIEAAITRFCAERRITMQQLFARVKPLPPAIDQARGYLDADVPADPQMQDALYQVLCQVVPGPNAHGGG
jgi:hypothetical protein